MNDLSSLLYYKTGYETLQLALSTPAMTTRRNRGSSKQSNSGELDAVTVATTFTRNKPDNHNDILNLRDSGTSYYSFSDLHHESDAPAQASSSRRDRDKGKAVDRPHSASSRRDRDVSTDEMRRSKYQDRADRHVYSGPLAHSEFERMKNEIDSLKKSAQDYKKTAKKQTKVSCMRPVCSIFDRQCYLENRRTEKPTVG